MKVFIEEGMYVEEGQLLAQLDDSTMKADLNYSQSQLDEAIRVFNRTKELAKEELASQASLDAARASVEGLEALNAVRKQVVNDMQILAPFSGVVVYKAAQPGEMISPVSAGGGFTNTGICTIVDMDSLEVEVDVNEAFINRVKPGQPVITNLNAYPKWDIPSEVIAIIPTADRNKATVKVRIALLEKDERVLPDMGSRVSFLRKVENATKETPKEGVMIPLGAVSKKERESIVQVIEGTSVEVTCPQVKKPIALRYAYKGFPYANLYNSEDLPCSPFRTDSFEIKFDINGRVVIPDTLMNLAELSDQAVFMGIGESFYI